LEVDVDQRQSANMEVHDAQVVSIEHLVRQESPFHQQLLGFEPQENSLLREVQDGMHVLLLAQRQLALAMHCPSLVAKSQLSAAHFESQ
jgi:hypothetical protein